MQQTRIIPGFNLSLGYTLTFLSLVVLIPLAGLFNLFRPNFCRTIY